MSIKLSEVIAPPKPITSLGDIQKPVITLSDTNKKVNNPPQSPEILLSNRNQILSQGTYIQAWRDFHTAIKPIMAKLVEAYLPSEKKENDTNNNAVSFRPFIEKNASDIKIFDETLLNLSETVKKGDFGYQDIVNIGKLFDTLNIISKQSSDSEETTKFKKYLKELNTDWDKLANTKDARTKFVYHLLQGSDLVGKLDSSIKKLSQSPLNQNADLALFSEKIGSAARTVREVGGNITAYAQSNNFNEQGLQKRTFELPDAFKEFTKILSDVAQNPLVQNNQEYIELLTNVYNNAMKVMQFFLPEIKQNIEKNQEYTQNAPTEKAPIIDKPESKLKSFMDKAADSVKMQQLNAVNNQQVIPQAQAMVMATPQAQAQVQAQQQALALASPQMSNQQVFEFLNAKANNPHNLMMPYSAKNSVHSPTSDDKELRALQGLWDWADHSVHMKNKINAVNEIGQSMEEMAMSGSGKPNPEMVALAKRSGRLNSLKSLMSEVPKINKSTQDLEKAALEAQHAYMTGVNQIATQKLKVDIDAAHMQSEQQKVYQKGLEKLGLDSLEMSTNMAKNYAKITGLFNEILMVRIDTVWDNIKRLTRGFKF